jgi:long-chain fatty acid transport protein
MRVLKTITASVCILFAAQVYAAGVDLTGVGARAQALGNYRAIAEDWSAMYWNPAGLTQTKGWHAGASLEFITPTVGYTPATYESPVLGPGQQFSTLRYENTENEPKTFLTPAAGVYYTGEKWAFGLGFWAPFGLGATWDLMQESLYNPNYPMIEFEDDLKVIDIHPTVAYKLNDKLSVGAGLSLVYADIMIRKPNFTPNPVQGLLQVAVSPTFKETFGAANAMYVAGSIMGLQSTFADPTSHLLTEVDMQGDGMGFGFNFGIKYDLTESFSVGISGQVYNDVELEGTLTKDTYFAHMNDGGAAYSTVNGVLDSLQTLTAPAGGLQAIGIDPQAEGAMRGMYSGGLGGNPGVVKGNPVDIKADMPLPMRFGLGVAYKGIKNLLVSADVAWTQWSTWDVIAIEPVSEADADEAAELVENWEDGIRAGIGLEYALSKVKLRGGFYTEPRAAVTTTMTPAIPDVNRRNVIIVGLEIPLGLIKLHASYEKMFIGDLDFTEWQQNPEGTGYENLPGLYDMNVSMVMFGLDYDF